MGSQETLLTQKKRGPKPTGKGRLIGIRMHDNVLTPLDAWIALQPDPNMNRQQAILQILKLHLKIEEPRRKSRIAPPEA